MTGDPAKGNRIGNCEDEGDHNPAHSPNRGGGTLFA
jgi:hypothetical protein